MFQPNLNDLHTDNNAGTSTFPLRQDKSRTFEKLLISCFQRIKQDCKIESFYTTGKQKKIECFSVDGFCSHCKTVVEAMSCFHHFCSCQEVRPCLAEEAIKHGSKEIELEESRRNFEQDKVFTVLEISERDWWRLHQKDNNTEWNIREK